MNAEEAARAHATDMKAEIDNLAAAEDWDAHAEIMSDLQDWVLKQAGVTSASHAGYIVILDRRLKDEDAQVMHRFLLNIKGVIAVEPVPENASMHIAERRALYRIQAAIEEAIYD
jgi:hypothetical protein